MNLLHVFNIYLWDNLKRYWNKFQFRKSLENAIAETCNAPSEIISHHYLWCPKPYKSNRWWLVLASQLRYTVKNSLQFMSIIRSRYGIYSVFDLCMLRFKKSLLQIAKRSRAWVWEWCSSPLVPRLIGKNNVTLRHEVVIHHWTEEQRQEEHP